MALELELKEITMLLRQTAGERAIDNAWKAKMTAVAAKS
jgi:hypothetical protein